MVCKAKARAEPFSSSTRIPSGSTSLNTYCRMARDGGVLVSINSDAHSVLTFDNLKYGIGQARLAHEGRCV